MEHLINPRVRNIQISGIRQFSNMVAKYQNAISLTIGQPDFATPEHVKQAGIRAIEENRTTYTHNAGLIELRRAVSDFVKTRYGLDYDPKQEIITTIGASQAIDIALRTILQEGNDVILPAPVYPGYAPVIQMCGATPVYVDTTETDFQITADMIEKRITDKTRCIILPYPSNPTGCLLDEQNLQDIARLLQDKEIFVLADEIYSELIYGRTHRSIASLPGMREKTIVINGVSKSHAMTGWRIGFALGPQPIMQHMLKVHQYNVSCASSISQYAALEALTAGRDDAEVMRAEYVKRRDFVYDRLRQMGLEVVKPEGAFYIFPSVRQFGLSSFAFAEQLLKEEELAVVPGSAFSRYGEGFVRISYAYADEVLAEGMNRLESFVQKIKATGM
ncbi:MAG: aminotransferase A [Bacillaceae bacterium]|nr:aminotransferase A [Bacillaceae bacterium]